MRDELKAIYEAMQQRYQAPEWLLTFEVRNKTGFGRGQTRYADAVALNTFPSRGHELHGFEFKTSRSDWQAELKDGSKAEAIFAYCDRWWLVSPKDIVREGELPKTWGHLVLHEYGLRAAKYAPELEPKARDWPFVVSLLRRIAGRAPVQGLDVANESRIRDECRRQLSEDAARHLRHETEALMELRRKIQEFESKSGIRIEHGWTWGKMDGALSILSRPDDLRVSLTRLADENRRNSKIIADALSGIAAAGPNAVTN